MSNPYVKFGVVALVIFVVLSVPLLWLFGGSFFGVALAYLLAINVATYLIYRYDKKIAGKGSTRVPENILLLLAAVGGSPAAFAAMSTLRHKTQKTSFQVKFWAIVAVQVIIIVGMLFFNPGGR